MIQQGDHSMDIYDPIGKALGLSPLEFDYGLPDIVPFSEPFSGEAHIRYGQKHTEESRHLMSLANKKRIEEGRHHFGKEHTQRQLKDGRHPFSNKENQIIGGRKSGSLPRSPAQLEQLRKHNAELAKRKSTCPHCRKTGQISIMQRWHFDRCKHRSLP